MSANGQDLIGDRYRLEERLGEGGFGAVWAAFDTALQRRVAVKLLDPSWDGRSAGEAEKLRARFRREAIVTASIKHPSVVTVYDIGLTGGDVFIVMELLEGAPLDDVLDEAPGGLDPERALPHFVSVLEGLGEGHEAGIVHKDLKPANLFLSSLGSPDETMSVIDFGVSRILHERKLTATGRIVGTPRYLAPEYIEEHRVSPALDVYQMGLILVEVLSGVSCIPRKLPLVTCCERHLAGDLEVPLSLLESPLGDLLLRATALDPEERFATGAEFAAALREVDPASIASPMLESEPAVEPARAPATAPTVAVGARAAPPNRSKPEPTEDASVPVVAPAPGIDPRLVWVLAALAVISVIGTSVALTTTSTEDSPARPQPEPKATRGVDEVADEPPQANAKRAARVELGDSESVPQPAAEPELEPEKAIEPGVQPEPIADPEPTAEPRPTPESEPEPEPVADRKREPEPREEREPSPNPESDPTETEEPDVDDAMLILD